MLLNKELLLKDSQSFILQMYEFLKNTESFDLKLLDSKKTLLVIVDVTNGFVREGNLKSERIEDIIPNIVKLCGNIQKLNIPIVSFVDSHEENCEEFNYFPPHCLCDSIESSMVEELSNLKNSITIKKNSTNGFLEQEFIEFLENNSNIENFIVVGDCTDICILQFSLTLKCFFNKNNKHSKVIVPLNGVETYSSPYHEGNLLNLFSLYNLSYNGIKIVREIYY